MKALSLSLILLTQVVGFAGDRLGFLIRVQAEDKTTEHEIFRAWVEGPPGTAIDLEILDPAFELHARFFTASAPDGVEIRSQLRTRRYMGKSKRDLPLWEEDRQQGSHMVVSGKQLTLLPFGDAVQGKILKTTLVPLAPRASILSVDGRQRPLEIEIEKNESGGVISVFASYLPERLYVDAEIRDGEKLLASGSATAGLQETVDLYLKHQQPEPSRLPSLLRFQIEEPRNMSIWEFATLRFSLYGEKNQKVNGAQNWMGIFSYEKPTQYPLDGIPGLKGLTLILTLKKASR